MKNSWGVNSGDKGYIYVSYADVNISKCINVVTSIENTNNYDNIYLHDPFGEVGRVNFNSDTIWFANVFNTINPSNENLSAVSFFNSSPNSKYEIWVSDSDDLTKKEMVLSGNVTNAGYYTIKLEKPINIKSSKLAVFVKLVTPNGIASAPVEKNITGYVSTAKAAKGESYISSNGQSWNDITDKSADTNVCVRAFTTLNKVDVTPYMTGFADGTFKPNGIVSYTEVSDAVSLALGVKVNAFEILANSGSKTDGSVTREQLTYILYKAMQYAL